jgi:hypothetical protein
LAVYQQMVALGFDVLRFWGIPRASQYAVIDDKRLWDDMQDVSRRVGHPASVELILDQNRFDIDAKLRVRMSYYLYPIMLQRSATTTLLYFGRTHEPCTTVIPTRPVLYEAERFCLFGTSG